jgi:AraC-like DNA-binding protein
MPQRIHRPGFPLSQYVELIWSMTGSGAVSSRQRVFPNGAMELVIDLKKDALSFFDDDDTRQVVQVPMLAGPYSHSFVIDPSEFSAAIGIRFRPGAARICFPVAAHELHNTDVPLAEVCLAEADRLLNEVCGAPDAYSQTLIVERYLQTKFSNAPPVHPAIQYAVEQLSSEGGFQSIRKIEADVGLSHTRLIQLFREHVGLTPKLFCRVRRFQAALSHVEKGMPVNWARLAAECGYFDQAHLTHDFREFAGVTPARYGSAMPRSDKRVPPAAASS